MSSRVILLLVLLFAIAVFMIQNAAIVTVHFLFWSFSTSKSLIILLGVIVGYAGGVTAAAIWRRRR